MCVKIVAECKEYVLLETVAKQDTQDRVFLFILLYRCETRLETTKIRKEWADLCEAKVGRTWGAVEDFFDLGFSATVKTYSFSWPTPVLLFCSSQNERLPAEM